MFGAEIYSICEASFKLLQTKNTTHIALFSSHQVAIVKFMD